MRRNQRSKPPRFREPYTFTDEGGASVESVVENVGYGFTHYTITGTPEQIIAAGNRILESWPNDPYSTAVYWPPEKWQHHNPPVDLGDGRWQAKAWRSNTSD